METKEPWCKFLGFCFSCDLRKKEVRFVTYRVRYVEGAMRVERERERERKFLERERKVRGKRTLRQN